MQPLRESPYKPSLAPLSTVVSWVDSSPSHEGCRRRGGRGTPLDHLLNIAARVAEREGLFEDAEPWVIEKLIGQAVRRG